MTYKITGNHIPKDNNLQTKISVTITLHAHDSPTRGPTCFSPRFMCLYDEVISFKEMVSQYRTMRSKIKISVQITEDCSTLLHETVSVILNIHQQGGTHFGRVFTFVSRIWIHLRSLTMRFCSFMEPGTAKSKSVVNWTFIIWNTGSCTVARARLARLSDAALLNCALTELEIFSGTPTSNTSDICCKMYCRTWAWLGSVPHSMIEALIH